MTFSDEDLYVIGCALVDSGSMRSSHEWYLKASAIHRRIVTREPDDPKRAAAPELYAALETARTRMLRYGERHEDIADIDAALAKARGEQPPAPPTDPPHSMTHSWMAKRCMCFMSPGPPWYAAGCRLESGHQGEHVFGTVEEAAEGWKSLMQEEPPKRNATAVLFDALATLVTLAESQHSPQWDDAITEAHRALLTADPKWAGLERVNVNRDAKPHFTPDRETPCPECNGTGYKKAIGRRVQCPLCKGSTHAR